MHARRFVSILALALGVTSAGCGGYYYGGRYNRTASRYGGQIMLTLVNDSPITVCYVQMGPSYDRNWGTDWLGRTETMPPGVARTFAVMGGPQWDIRVQTCAHQVIAEVHGMPVQTPMQVSVRQLQQPAYVAPQPAYVAPAQGYY